MSACAFRHRQTNLEKSFEFGSFYQQFLPQQAESYECIRIFLKGQAFSLFWDKT